MACRGLAEKVTLEQRPEGGEGGGSQIAVLGHSRSGGRHGKCKGLVTGLCLAHEGNHEGAGVAGSREGGSEGKSRDKNRKRKSIDHKRSGRASQMAQW